MSDTDRIEAAVREAARRIVAELEGRSYHQIQHEDLLSISDTHHRVFVVGQILRSLLPAPTADVEALAERLYLIACGEAAVPIKSYTDRMARELASALARREEEVRRECLNILAFHASSVAAMREISLSLPDPATPAPSRPADEPTGECCCATIDGDTSARVTAADCPIHGLLGGPGPPAPVEGKREDAPLLDLPTPTEAELVRYAEEARAERPAGGKERADG